MQTYIAHHITAASFTKFWCAVNCCWNRLEWSTTCYGGQRWRGLCTWLWRETWKWEFCNAVEMVVV